MNEQAFNSYVAARRPQLFRTACLLCGDPHRAEDIVQDALARLYGVWDRVSRMDNIDGYVRRIIVNAHYSDRRRPWRREAAAEPRDVPLKPGFPVEDADAIRSALRALPLASAR
ncbi:sigma factor [Nocardioides humilatus]|uniref:sigma factor n=1 Tax=Nocardioides humilatus TaxID=2607660 RepID=UPI001FE4437A|nr:sigma factor [Nocardioides humilatus]